MVRALLDAPPMSPHQLTAEELTEYALATVDALRSTHHGALPRIELMTMLRGVGLDDDQAEAVMKHAFEHGLLVEQVAVIRATALRVAA